LLSLKNRTIAVPFPSARLARIAKGTLEVDPEVKGSLVRKTFSVREAVEGTDAAIVDMYALSREALS